MESNAEIFVASFNRIEKWLKQELGNPSSMGFSEMVRRLSKRQDLLVKKYSDDLLQLAQLRNAIVHDQIAPDFVIAEPNEWAVNKLTEIENDLLNPEKVIPTFAKKVTRFEATILLSDLLKIVADKSYSQFPIYEKGRFLGLITAHGLGIWLAKHSHNNHLDIEGTTAREVLQADRKSQNYHFIHEDTLVNQALEIFIEQPSLEALLITKDGNPNGNLIGIIRPRDVYKKK